MAKNFIGTLTSYMELREELKVKLRDLSNLKTQLTYSDPTTIESLKQSVSTSKLQAKVCSMLIYKNINRLLMILLASGLRRHWYRHGKVSKCTEGIGETDTNYSASKAGVTTKWLSYWLMSDWLFNSVLISSHLTACRWRRLTRWQLTCVTWSEREGRERKGWTGAVPRPSATGFSSSLCWRYYMLYVTSHTDTHQHTHTHSHTHTRSCSGHVV